MEGSEASLPTLLPAPSSEQGHEGQSLGEMPVASFAENGRHGLSPLVTEFVSGEQIFIPVKTLLPLGACEA